MPSLTASPAGGEGTQVALRARWDAQFSDGTTALSAVSQYKMPNWKALDGAAYWSIGGASVSGNEIIPGTPGLYLVHAGFALAPTFALGPLSVDHWVSVQVGIDDRGANQFDSYDAYRTVELAASSAGRSNDVVVDGFIVIDAVEVIRTSVQWIDRGTADVDNIACYGAWVSLNRIGDVP